MEKIQYKYNLILYLLNMDLEKINLCNISNIQNDSQRIMQM